MEQYASATYLNATDTSKSPSATFYGRTLEGTWKVYQLSNKVVSQFVISKGSSIPNMI